MEKNTPTTCQDSPADAEQGWRLGVKDGRVKDGEVLDADSGSELIMINSV